MEPEGDGLLLLQHLAAGVDANLARLSIAQEGVKVSTDMFRAAAALYLRGQGLDPDHHRVSWDGRQITIEEK